MTNMLDRLRDSRHNPSVLQIRILHIRSRLSECAIFVFEGPEDVPVYEEWLGKIASCPHYQPLPGSGKKQVLGLLQQLGQSELRLLNGVYFFVDRDFDPQAAPHPQLHELQAYSIENLLCTPEVLESILRDELRSPADLDTKQKIHDAFAKFCQDIGTHCKPVNLGLFAAVRLGRTVIAKPEKVSQIVDVDIESASAAYVNVDDVLTIEPPINVDEIQQVRSEFDVLPAPLQQRGKYRLDAFRKWLRLVTADAKSDPPKYFPKQNLTVGDPGSATHRRFASGVRAPETLVDFCNLHFGGGPVKVDSSEG
jgi:Protein of unknown function (DUF4435)